MRVDIVPGAKFPDYELSDHTGKHRKLSELQEQDPMVLVLGRGGYCPKDRRQAEGLLQLHREMEVGYCRPDWDITKPELRAAWQEAHKELFYPYGKTFTQTLGEKE
jgi:hypothetical protein